MDQVGPCQARAVQDTATDGSPESGQSLQNRAPVDLKFLEDEKTRNAFKVRTILDVQVLHRAGADTELTLRLFEALKAWEHLKTALGPDPGVVYLAGPLRGNGSAADISHNQQAMATLARWAQAVLPTTTLIVPHLNFKFVDESGEQGLEVRARVLRSCERLVARCDAIVLCGGLTEGMRRERQVAEFLNVPTFSVPGWDDQAAPLESLPASQAV